ncbi:outer membrane protein assembly factor BamC [Mariprofundus sp. NF]|nr:outer membrane protein assembly factor BamC [Mariprofundus sp. NF]
MKRYLLILPMISLLSACEGKQFFYPNDQQGPAYTLGNAADPVSGKPRAPLDVPPELQAELEVPMAGEVASRADEKVLSKDYQDAVAGKAIALDARIYPVDAAKVFSAVVDAMTSMNIPVDSVDSPSGIITTDWIRRGSAAASMFDFFGSTSANTPTRHRYIVRVYRAKIEGQDEATKLEVRVHGQMAINRTWVNKTLKQKVTDQLFVGVDEQLERMQQGVTGQTTGDTAQ